MNTVILVAIFCFEPVSAKHCIALSLAPFKSVEACQSGAWDTILGTVRAIPNKPDAISYTCLQKGFPT